MAAEFSDFEDEEGVEEPTLSDSEQVQHDEDAIVEKPLTTESIGECLSLICKTGNGLAHAYVRLDIRQKEITDISILKHFIHLRYIDISNNKIKDLSSLGYLSQILTLKADQNLLKSAKLTELPYLQKADFSQNKITDVEGINHPLLDTLNLNDNEISEISPGNLMKLTRLSTLELRSNKLSTTKGLCLPSLKKLYVGDNLITTIEDIGRMEHLTTLYLGGNRLSKLDGFSDYMKNLQYLNLTKNDISELNEINKLKCLPLLRALILQENPVSYEEAYRIEVLVILRRLERLDQDSYLEEERQEAEDIYNQRAESDAQADPGAVEVIHSEEED